MILILRTVSDIDSADRYSRETMHDELNQTFRFLENEHIRIDSLIVFGFGSECTNLNVELRNVMLTDEVDHTCFVSALIVNKTCIAGEKYFTEILSLTERF